ncbi:hypothetical protein BG53_12395 [Paenibacillus darwinianus]|uniref:DUF1294 domain-containing protein n=1 Tax=Paenibacillus darwinianus TaxID=1380763 RepID=A0A9W5W7W8_9BACL|nr:DUF1294 domain-containing protein [Paenibacillus darwinianus]EXX90365.1 hypothetical protein BG52_13550 [Paenibacillus darwinianus]EXX91013.1 hypothetical protein BG53_12395 [Paenibacillus darwinianus]EXX91036.1 hypothetical protein CH50_14235 [Paenibacillus darwinianus]
MILLGVYLAAVNLLLFVLMGADKRMARQGRRRIPERWLFALAWLGGAAGGWIGMRLWRHKTKHRSFSAGFPILTLLNIALIITAFRIGWFE